MLKTSEFSRLQLYKIVKYFYPPYVDLKQKERTMQTRHFPILEGSPSPLGTSLLSSGVNFAFFSRSPKATLWIFSQKEKEPLLNLPLDPSLHKTGPIWHVFVQGLIPPFEYVLEIQGEMLLDPYAKALSSAITWGQEEPYAPRSLCFSQDPFDWQGVKKPNIPPKEWIIYEMHVRGFTIDPSSNVTHKGTFLGMIEKIPHLISLGVNAVELLPLFEFNECENKNENPFQEKRLYNFWGYS